MKKLIIYLLFLLPLSGFSQALSLPSVFFSTRTDMRGQKGTEGVQVLLNGLLTTNDGNGGVYMWNATSTDTDDGFVTLAVTGVTTGRWKRIGNGNTLKFSRNSSGTVLQTAYQINYDVPLPFVPITVIAIPRSAPAAALCYVTNITNTGFTLNYLTVPILGTNNIINDFIVIKQ